MVIFILTDCPPKVKGDLSKWLFEINTGVYVGRVSARVREEIWSRICASVRHGQATMVYGASGEQKMEFRVHNTTWEIVDYDGIKLMRRPLPRDARNIEEEEPTDQILSNAAIMQRIRRIQGAQQKTLHGKDYTVLDLETTGLSPLKDHVIEIAALRIRNDCVTETFHRLVQCPVALPTHIVTLTGLTDMELQGVGRPLPEVVKDCLLFIGTDLLVLHHAAFDLGFLQAMCRKAEIPAQRNPHIDTLKLARQKLCGLASYSLESIASHFGLDTTGCHRATRDCELTLGIYQKLKEI